MGRPNWDDLRVFLELARRGTLLGAAERLGIDAATVGRRVAALERALDTRLFDRSQRGYALTEAGRRLVDPAEAMEAAATGAADRLAGQTETLSGAVRIGAPGGIATTVVAPALAQIARDHPDLRLELVALPRVFSLSQREVDIAIALTPPAGGRLRTRRIADYRLHLYASEALIAEHGLTDRASLRAVRFIGYIPDMIFDKELDYLPQVDAEIRPQLASTALNIQLGWTAAGEGVCILPDFIARTRPNLRRVLPETISFTRSFHLIRHQDDLRAARITVTADRLAAAVRAHLA